MSMIDCMGKFISKCRGFVETNSYRFLSGPDEYNEKGIVLIRLLFDWNGALPFSLKTTIKHL